MSQSLTAEASITAEVDMASTRRARTEAPVGEIRTLTMDRDRPQGRR